MKLQIAPDSTAKRTLALTAQLPGRLRYLQQSVPHHVAEYAVREIRAALPDDPNQKSYLNALQLRRFSTRDTRGVAIVLNPKSRGVDEVDPAQTLVFVFARRGGTPRARKAVSILQKHNPWTLAMLPFLPTQREARLASRSATQAEVKAVTKARREDQVQWQRALARGGFLGKRNQLRPPTRPGRLMPDVAFEGVRLEFGFGGSSAQPHWRPGIRAAVRYLKGGYQRRSDVRRLLTDPGFRTWRRGPPRVPWIPQPRLKGYAAFQSALFPRGIP